MSVSDRSPSSNSRIWLSGHALMHPAPGSGVAEVAAVAARLDSMLLPTTTLARPKRDGCRILGCVELGCRQKSLHISAGLPLR